MSALRILLKEEAPKVPRDRAGQPVKHNDKKYWYCPQGIYVHSGAKHRATLWKDISTLTLSTRKVAEQ